MSRVLLFAGTTEGRELAEFLERQGVVCDVCVATEYGQQLLDQKMTGHRIYTGRLTMEEMSDLMRSTAVDLTVDATHPYATVVSDNIRGACRNTGCTYLRLLRDVQETEGQCVFVETVEEAVNYLAGTTGNILAATGSKELEKYTALPDYKERVFARVLSTRESVDASVNLGFQGKNLICMQGPFGEELNYAMLKQVNARFLVTKESGKTGGFPEKMRAAARAGARLVVVGRPAEAAGYSALEIRRILCRELSIAGKREVSLVGIGMGNPDNMTIEAQMSCQRADILIGAGRMLECVTCFSKPVYQAYQPEEIRSYLEDHPEYERAAILLSGDVGFYSGAKKLLECFPQEQVTLYSGISSVVYLCAKLRTSWEDVKLVSIHGRAQNLTGAVRTHKKVFALVGKQDSFRQMCLELMDYGYEDVTISVGCDLSYPEEKILTGTPEALLEEKVGDLTAVLIENSRACAVVTHGVEDECFLRNQVPMTKSEIRSISLSKLGLERGSCIYDVGAGTGSVAVEMALQAVDGQVYAIEKKPEAVELIRRNRKKFGVSNLKIVEGSAPEAIEDLPMPTHVFIGGSSGNLMAIMELVLKKNQEARIVINAIALETVAEALRCVKTLPVEAVDIVAVSVGKAREVGAYHMMMGQNPVYIISCTGTRR